MKENIINKLKELKRKDYIINDATVTTMTIVLQDYSSADFDDISVNDFIDWLENQSYTITREHFSTIYTMKNNTQIILKWESVM